MRKVAAQAEELTKQQSLEPYLTAKAPQERVIPYSDDLFRDAAIQWMVETHQVCCISHVLVFWAYKNMVYSPFRPLSTHPSRQ